MQGTLAINDTQKYLIKIYFENDIFENIAEKNSDPQFMIQALSAIISDTKLGKNKISVFKEAGVWEFILIARKILVHPCPQNRSVSSVVVINPQEGFVYYQAENGELACEQKGLFNLNIKNDESAASITRESMFFFIKNLVEAEIEKYRIEIEVNSMLCAHHPALQFSSRPIDNNEVVLSDNENDDDDFDLKLMDESSADRQNESCMRKAYNVAASCSIL